MGGLMAGLPLPRRSVTIDWVCARHGEGAGQRTQGGKRRRDTCDSSRRGLNLRALQSPAKTPVRSRVSHGRCVAIQRMRLARSGSALQAPPLPSLAASTRGAASTWPQEPTAEPALVSRLPHASAQDLTRRVCQPLRAHEHYACHACTAWLPTQAGQPTPDHGGQNVSRHQMVPRVPVTRRGGLSQCHDCHGPVHTAPDRTPARHEKSCLLASGPRPVASVLVCVPEPRQRATDQRP